MKPAVLFDMNGVLVDDEDLHRQAFLYVASGEGLTMDNNDYFTFFAGRTDHDGFMDFLGDRYQDTLSRLEHLLLAKAAAYKELASTELRSYQGAAELVRKLDDLGYDIGLATSSTSEEAETVLQYLDLDGVFDAVITAEHVSKGKPDPEPFIKAASALHRRASECVIVEDAPSGIAAARAARMHIVAVASTHDTSELSNADLVVGSIGELSAGLIDRLVT